MRKKTTTYLPKVNSLEELQKHRYVYQYYGKIVPNIIRYVLRPQHSRISTEDKYGKSNINEQLLKYPQTMKYVEKL